MSVPATCTLPSAFASGFVSCMRFRQRINVDLPQPDGPITAVACLASTDMLMPCRASVLPNQAFKLRTSTAIGISLARLSEHTPQENKANKSCCSHDGDHQHQGPGPGLAMPLFIRRNCVVENLQGESRNWLTRAETPKSISESREQQRCRFTCYTRESQHDAGNDARSSGGQSDR